MHDQEELYIKCQLILGFFFHVIYFSIASIYLSIYLYTYKTLITLIVCLFVWLFGCLFVCLFETVRTNPGYGMATLIYNNLLNLISGTVILLRSS